MFSKAVKLFNLGGFDIKVDPSWLVIAALITWSLTQFFPTSLPGQSQAVYLGMALFAMLSFFVSLLLHELAHSVTARHYGVQIKSITLFLFGGMAEMKTEPTEALVEFRIAIAGPLMSFLLALWFWALAALSEAATAPAALTTVLSYLGTINLVLAVFNLVPAFPLDGGRVLRAYLWHRSGDPTYATRIATQSGAIVGYLLMGLGLMAVLQGALVAGIWQIMIGGFVVIAARASYQNQLLRGSWGDTPVARIMQPNPVTITPETTLADFANHTLLERGLSFVPVVEDGVLLGHIDRAMLAAIDRDNWADTRVGDVFAGLEPGTTTPPETTVQALMERISNSGRRKFLVTRGTQLAGVVSLADLTSFLSRAGTAPVQREGMT